MKNLINRNKVFIQLISATIFAIVLAAIFTYPSILHLNSLYIGDGWDNYEYASYQALAAKHMAAGELPFHATNFWRYPVGFEFDRGFDSFLTVTIGAVLVLLLGLPLAYNTTIIILMTLNGVLSFVYFRYLSRSFILGILGMIIFGFSFYVLGKASSHPNLLFVGGFPLFLWAVLRINRLVKLHMYDFFILFASIALIALGSLEYALFFGIFLLLYGTITFLFYKEAVIAFLKKILLYRKIVCISATVVFGAVGILFLPYIEAFINHAFSITSRKETLYAFTPGLSDFIFPNTYLTLWIKAFATSTTLASIEKVVFVGWAEILLLIGFLYFYCLKRAKLFFSVLLLSSLLLAMGYGQDNHLFFLPYRFLSNLFPFAVIAETGRYIVIFYLFLTSAIILFLASIKNDKTRNILIAIVLVFVFLERLPSGYYLTGTLENKQLVKSVQSIPASAVLDFPIYLTYARYNLLSIFYDKPIVNGYFHWSADGAYEQSFIKNSLLDRYICDRNDPILALPFDYFKESQEDQKMLDRLKSYNINTIVIHKDDKLYHTECTNVRLRLSRLLPYIAYLNPSSAQKQINASFMDGKPSFSFFLPYSGTFYLDGIFVNPSNPSQFLITHNNLSLGMPYGWENRGKTNGLELIPKYTLSIPVAAGDQITIYSPNTSSETGLALWYRYIKTGSQSVFPHLQFIKVFEDEKAIVYRVN